MQKKALNPPTTEYEFLGPIGAFLMIIVLPLLLYMLHLGCTPQGCPSQEFIAQLISPSYLFSLITPNSIVALFDPTAFFVYSCFMVYLLVSWYLLPGLWVEGTPLRNGKTIWYKVNGFKSYLVLVLGILTFLWSKGPEGLSFISDRFIGLLTASVIFSFAVSLYVYLASFRAGEVILALGGNSGNIIYDYMIGRELNPRIGSFDIKYFIELRPGLFSWTIINIAMAAKQYQDLGNLTMGMFLVTLFQVWYCADGIFNEPAVLTTLDITMDGFGWMLSFGNISWVAFMYPLQTRYLALHPVHLSWLQIIGIVSLKAIGFAIFRGANNEKNIFRTNPDDPKVKHLKYISTKAGSRLITSGWWGRARHINYLGDFLMSCAWCLPCGFDDIFPYFYLVYFAVLLVHRELRDEAKCQKKYGKDWTRYCEIVKWRIIPGVY